MTKLVGLTAALAAAVAVLVVLTLPPRRTTLPVVGDGTVAGILHIHSSRSDGLSPPDVIAAAAARAGLKFIVFTDHGDATRAADPPVYRSGVLCLDGVEISTRGGHYVAFDMPAAPYPLAGEPRDVVEDVRRLGGFGVAAHPDSPKPQLRWTGWSAPFDGIELLNPDTSWRILAQEPGWQGRGQLLTALLDYPFRPTETIASLLQPSRAVPKWLEVAQRRRVVGIGGVDAHAKINLRGDPGDVRNGWSLPLPGYEASFRTMSVHVALDRVWTGNAAADAAVLMRGIRAGHLYTALDGVAGPPAFAFSATNEFGTVHEGDELTAGGPVALHVRSNAPPSFTTVVYAGPRPVTTVRDPQDLTVHASAQPAVYWVEILTSGAHPITWLRSNPIYVRSTTPLAPAPPRPPPTVSVPLFTGASVAGWRTEHTPTSRAGVEVPALDADLQYTYGLARPAPPAPVAALVIDTPTGIAPSTRLAFTARATQPMRISIQLRGGEGEVERWERSVFIDRFDEDRTVFFDDFVPVGQTSTPGPPLRTIRSILFVVDTTHAKAGSSGSLWFKRVDLQQ